MEIEPVDGILKSAFSPERFREEGHVLVDQLFEHLSCLYGQQPGPSPAKVIRWTEPDQANSIWNAISAPTSLRELTDQALQHSIHLHHPHFLGHQISPPLPGAALVGLLVDLLNNGMGVYEMGIAGTAAEQAVVEMVAAQFGMPPTAGGIMTSGGSLANLTAMLAARQSKAKRDIWQTGNNEVQLGVMVCESSHYCIDRAIRIMGLGENGLIKVPYDRAFRMRVEMLDSIFAAATQQGIVPIAVVGNACSTSAGAFDDLNAIAEFCRRSNLWFHVDGAHGAALAFSDQYQERVAGIGQADSVTLDFHKMLLIPAVSSALIFRDNRQSYRTFAQQAEYLWADNEDDQSPDLARRTFECTKTMMSLKVLAIWKQYGLELFAANIDRLMTLTEHFAEVIESRATFELAYRPQCNIVCFRYLNAEWDDETTDRVNRSIRQELLEDGTFYIVQTTLNGKIWLRCTVTNSMTTPDVFGELLNKIESIARR